MQPFEGSLNSCCFLKVFLDLSPPLSFDYVLLVANASGVLFIISQVLAYIMASDSTLTGALDSLVALVEFDVLPFDDGFTVPKPMVLCNCSNGVDSCFLWCGSAMSTLVPG